MNKLLIVILVFGVGALVYYLIAGNTGILPPGVEVDEEADMELIEEGLRETGKRTVYGSCNDIPNSSSCVDYVGSMWKDYDTARLSCGDDRVFSKNACPYSTIGGCQTSGGTIMEMIIWAYTEGPGEYNDESLPYAIMACNSTPNSQWVTPESLLE